MNQDLYKQIKTILNSYTYDDQANFYALFKYAKQTGLHGLSFKQFTKHAKAMGVSSGIKRVDSKVQRSLLYDAKADDYVLGLFPVLDTCPSCEGTGLVKIDMTQKSIDKL